MTFEEKLETERPIPVFGDDSYLFLTTAYLDGFLFLFSHQVRADWPVDINSRFLAILLDLYWICFM